MNITIPLLIPVFVLVLMRLTYILVKRHKLWEKENSKEFGDTFKRLVRKELKSLPRGYEVFDNLMFANKDKITSTLIEHLVVSPYGVFVIESKALRGYIRGNSDSNYWTQKLGRFKYFLNSPIRQNEQHLECLRWQFYQEEIPLIPIIVFCNEANLDVQTDENCHIVKIGDLVETIEQHNEWILDRHLTVWISETIIRRARIPNELCPLCGGQLKLRRGRFGCFIGCSNFPGCSFTSNKANEFWYTR